MTTQFVVIHQHLASLSEDCIDASEGIREFFGFEADVKPPEKRFYRGMRGFIAASFTLFPLLALTIRPR
jgi:hypothetical protein